ncbi:unnamed protein product [Tilletia caries]|nr:unnamed protein product [Tilletia caries]
MLPGARKPGYQAAFEQQMTLHDRDGAVEHALDHDDMASGAEDDEIGALCDEVHAAMAEAAEHETSEDWTPFESASEAYAAIVFNNPRFPMSRQHAQIALRFAKGSGARNVPSYTKVQASLARLRSLYGTQLRRVQGQEGNIFYVAPIATAIRRAFGDPSTRPHMRFTPSETGHFKAFFDASRLGIGCPTTYRQPVVHTDDNTPIWLDEVAANGTQLFVPRQWYRGKDDRLYGRGNRCERAGVGFQMTDHIVDHPVATLKAVRGIIHDLSGNKSKKWGALSALSYQFANLPAEQLCEERSILHFSISNDATALEMMDAFVKEIETHHTTAIRVWDCELQSEVDVLVRPVCLVADNPMHAILSSNIGMLGAKPCRVCTWGGTKVWKQGEDRIRMAMERSSEDAIDTLSQQLQYARDDNTKQYYDSRTDTGYSDGFTHSVALTLLEDNDVLRGKDPAHPDTPRPALSEAEVVNAMNASHLAYNGAEFHNPLLRLKAIGWDVTQSTPVEVLHTFLLGPVKYLLRATKRNMTPRQLDLLQIQLEALNTDGLPCGKTFRAAYIIKHADSLVGKAIYVSEIERESIGDHLIELDAALVAFYSAYARVNPFDLVMKPKLHIMSHLVEDIVKFGPPSMFNTERFEANNTIIRNVAILSNRSAISLDIMRKLEDQAMLRFVIGGGQMLVVEGGAQHILPQGERLRNLGLQATSRHLLRQWGLYKTLALKAGSTSLEPAAQEERATTIIAGIQHAASDVLSERDLLSTYRAGKTVLSLSRDICHVGSFVLIDGKLQDGRGSAERTGTLTAARIRSICVPNNGLASTFLIVLLLDDTGWNEDLAARTMKESKALAVVKAKRVVQLINVQHNCVSARCEIEASGGRDRQSREPALTTKPAIKHTATRKYFVNHFLLRSCLPDRRYRLPEVDFPEADRDEIAAFVADRIEDLNIKKKQKKEKDKQKGKQKQKGRQDQGVEQDEFLSADDDN